MENLVNDLKHFGHQHPLEYARLGFQGNGVCSACTLNITPSKFFYQCKVCRFSLHKVCYSMPKRVMHPADPNHHLTLLPSPTTSLSTECGACGHHIAGFYYSCAKCSCYYHMLCVAMPSSVKIPSSHPHILKLELKPPYDFQCDVCDKPSYRGWLYRCRICEFDAHVSCAISFKEDQRSPDHSFDPGISSLQDDKIRAPMSQLNELMELLSEGMKGFQAKSEMNLDGDQFQSLDQSILISENFTLPSCQFSDSCFSIDIAKSIQIEDKANEASREANSDNQVRLQEFKKKGKDQTVIDSSEKLQVAQKHSFSFGTRNLKTELSLAPLTGIGSGVWEDLGKESRKNNSNAPNEKMPAIKTENMNTRRPVWLKLLSCF